MRICLEEVRRCQALSPRPNFAMLFGDRYELELVHDFIAMIQAPTGSRKPRLVKMVVSTSSFEGFLLA
jgi:hypothetical protein